jgi:hypothetical protein
VATELLAACLGRFNPQGRRAAALVLGEGLNAQSFAETDPPRPAPWTLALKALVAELNAAEQRRIAQIPPYHHALYDEFRAVRSDHWLRHRLCEELEKHSGADTDPPLYGEIAAGEFEVIMTLSICAAFPRAVGASRRKPPGVYYPWELYRKSVVRFKTERGLTDIWQVHGSCDQPEGIRLGMYDHAQTIAELERFRIQLLQAWPLAAGRLVRPETFLEMHGPLPFSWFKHLLLRPLVFVGARLDPSDWPMWWLLHQRARVHSVFDPSDRPPSLVLTSRTDPHRHLANGPADLQLIEFDDYRQLWGAVRHSLMQTNEKVEGPTNSDAAKS